MNRIDRDLLLISDISISQVGYCQEKTHDSQHGGGERVSARLTKRSCLWPSSRRQQNADDNHFMSTESAGRQWMPSNRDVVVLVISQSNEGPLTSASPNPVHSSNRDTRAWSFCLSEPRRDCLVWFLLRTRACRLSDRSTTFNDKRLNMFQNSTTHAACWK